MQVKSVSQSGEELLNQDSALWDSSDIEQIDLMGVPVAMQPSSYIREKWQNKKVGLISSLQVKALHNGKEIALFLEWADPQEDISRKDNDHFPDGAAVMFPLKDDAPLMTMGSPDQPVNAWHWAADNEDYGSNNVAAGFGTSRVTKGSNIKTAARYQNGHWQLIFLRQLQLPVDTAKQLHPRETVKITYAVWAGSNGERGGLKAFSPMWHELSLS